MSQVGTGSLQEVVSVHKLPKVNQGQALHECVRGAVRQYLSDRGDHLPDDMYRFVLAEVERPLIEEVLSWTGGNQVKTAQILGINRGTLRKKLKLYGISCD